MLEMISGVASVKLFHRYFAILLIFAVVFFLYFAHYFSGKEINLKEKFLFLIPFVPVVLLMFTKYNASIESNGNECFIVEGSLHWYAYLLGVVYMGWAVSILIRRFKEKGVTYKEKYQIAVIIIALLFIVFWFIFFLALDNYYSSRLEFININQFMLFGILFFISLVTYAITEHWLFAFNPVIKKVFISIIWAILFGILFFIQPGTVFSWVAFAMYLLLIVVFWVGSLSPRRARKKDLTRASIIDQVSSLKLVSIQIATVFVWLLIGSQFFLVKDQSNRILVGVTLVITITFGVMLIGSIKQELKKREQLQKINIKLKKREADLRKANRKLENDKKIVEAANVELERLDKAKSEFLNISSHQLRTPVSVIKGVASMFMDGDLDNAPLEEKRKFYKSILFKSEKLETIIHDILNATSFTARKYSLMDKDVESIDLYPFLTETLKDFDQEVKERNLILTLSPPKEPLTILGQKEYLREAFLNLITNAIKYTPSTHKTNDVRGQREEQGVITLTLEKDATNVIIKVEDNGIGIPKEELPKLFHRFYRATNATGMYTDGTGLGLFVAKEIVKGHGGKITVKSQLGKGTTFAVSLPMKPKGKVDVRGYILNEKLV
jgi:signal transduction histidine kinase